MTPSPSTVLLPATWVSLHRKLESMAPNDRYRLQGQVREVANGALKQVQRKLPRLAGLRFKEPPETLSIAFSFMEPGSALPSDLSHGMHWAKADLPSRTVLLLTWAGFAPKEVVRALVTHEACHIAFSILEPECIGPIEIKARARRYPEDRQIEEQWVSNLTKQLGYDECASKAWIESVDLEGTEWRREYYDRKKAARSSAEGT